MAPLLLDRQSLHSFYGDAADITATIMTDYLANLDGTLASLRTAFAAGCTELGRAAHFHAPVFSYVGFPQLHTECKTLEGLCSRTNDVHTVHHDFETLLTRIDQSRQLVKAELLQAKAVA